MGVSVSCLWRVEGLPQHGGGGPGPRASCALTPGTVSRSLEAISGLEGSGRIFTVLVQGLLQLQVRSEGWVVRRGPCL